MSGTNRRFLRFEALLALTAMFLLLVLSSQAAFAQATIQAGSIQGVITDPSGAVVPGATVTISNRATGQTKNLTTSSSGAYNSGPMPPGDYSVKASGQGFSTVELPTTVSVGNITPGNIKLGVAGAQQSVTVESTGVQVNTEQPTVQGVITSSQLESLPFNGRNFLEAAQLEPGVQIQDGGNFDPTKLGYTGVSIGGRQGRTTRIEVDGVDITDETVGTTTQNLNANAIQEFQISQSTLDMSTELTSSGAVNVTTKSGTNNIHGDAFYDFRDKRAGAANFPGGQDVPFQRNHVGATLGGPVLKDRVFFFGSGERILQHLFAPVDYSGTNFAALSGGYQAPFKEKNLTGKLDWNVGGSAHLFYRFSYDNNLAVGSTLPNFQPFSNRDNTPSHAVGFDFNTGTFTHSIRFGYLKFVNGISDAAALSGAFNPEPNINLRITGITPQFRTGPNSLAPQGTFQSSRLLKYDGSKIRGSHIIRYGTTFNAIRGGGFASFVGLAPIVNARASASAAAAAGPFPGGKNNPLNYPVTSVLMGNGQGFFTELPQFGFPAGGQYDNRWAWYLGDSWKLKPNFTLTYGLRYNRDTGRADSDLPGLTCNQIDQTQFTTPPPCSGTMLDGFGNIPGLGNRVNQPNSNFSPTVGFSWDPFKDGKTAIRAGGGLYYENAVFNNVLFDRPLRLPKGLFNVVTASTSVCPSGNVAFPNGQTVTSINGKTIATQICGQPIGSVANDIAALQTAFEAATAKAGAAANPGFVGENLAPANFNTFIAPNYQSPRSWQMNVGVQRELAHGMVFTADYVRNVSLRYLLSVDTNQVGNSRYLNKTAAANAIAATLTSCGAATIDQAIASGTCPGPQNTTHTATIDDFASNGLDSGRTYLSGFPAEYTGNSLTPDTGAAFPGINPFYGQNSMLFPVGRSVYNALQLSLKHRMGQSLPGIKSMTTQISYSLSRFRSMVGDQDFVETALDQQDTTRYFGPTSFDRTHQFGFGTVFTLPASVQVSFVGHLNSPLPGTLVLEDQFRSGEIFHTDVTGDGTTGDVLPGTNIGSFMRSISPSSIGSVINNYNSSQAGKLTPAGQALVSAGMFTQAQLVALGAVQDTLAGVTPGTVGNDWLRVFDLRAAVPIKIRERVSITPSVSIFNLLNFANFNISPANRVDTTLTTSTPFGTTYAEAGNRAGLGSGVFTFGAPRQVEFGLRIAF